MDRIERAMAALALMIAVTGCDAVDSVGPGGADYDARNLDGEYVWLFQDWEEGSPRGFPAVNLTWDLPVRYQNEPFRVYAARSGGSYGLIATVTSCSNGVCRFTDTNVVAGRSYDYYVATFDERGGNEIGVSEAVRVDVADLPSLTVPATPRVTSLDGAAFLSWDATGAVVYRIVSELEDGSTFLIGETDGTSFLDDRAENGQRYRYYIAGADLEGHVSGLSQGGVAFPRPDFHADIVYAHADSPDASGFRFVTDEGSDPIVSGTSQSAHWRLEAVAGGLRIVPLGQTAITQGTFTTELTCGPGSDATCEDIGVAPGAGAFSSTPVMAQTGNTYVLRVVGSDSRTHFAKLRVQGPTVDSSGRRLIVFDWAYQVRADEPSLEIHGRNFRF